MNVSKYRQVFRASLRSFERSAAGKAVRARESGRLNRSAMKGAASHRITIGAAAGRAPGGPATIAAMKAARARSGLTAIASKNLAGVLGLVACAAAADSHTS